MNDEAINGVMKFAQNFAIPTLLFIGIANIELSEKFQAPLFISFYIGAFSAALSTFLLAHYIFKRNAVDSIAIGFVSLFSNSVLLGLPITERAYGAEALDWNFPIISIHSPLLISSAIIFMEIAKSHNTALPLKQLVAQIFKSVFKNPLILGISLGWFVNITNFPVPRLIWEGADFLKQAAIPASLFSLGGVLYRYKPEGDFTLITWAIGASLIIHPTIAYMLAHFVFKLDVPALRSIVITASMAPGITTYVFANMYGVGMRIAASSVLIGTALSLFTIWGWLTILP